jgi:O-antigen/teichoic acid export membrane protein
MAIDIAKRSARGSLILFASNLAATFLNAITVVLMARLLGPTSYGTFSLALVVPSILQLFIGFGALPAVVRYAAYYTSIGREEEAKRFTSNVMMFLFITGTALTLLTFFLARDLSALILQRPGLQSYVQLTSISVLGTTMLQAAAMSAIGWNWMSLSGSTMALQALLRLALSVPLVLIGLGVTGALTGYLVSLFLAGGIGLTLLQFGKLRRGLDRMGSFVADIKMMNAYGLPVYAGTVMTGLASYFVLAYVAHISSNTVYGYYQAAVNFTSPAALLATAMVSALFPAFASIYGMKADISTAFKHAYRFVAFLLTPLIIFIIASPGPLVRILYGPEFAASVPYLQLLGFAYLPTAFGYSVHPAFFNGFGKTRLTLILYFTTSTSLVLAAVILATTFGLGVYGLILAIFLSDFVAWSVGTYMAYRFLHVTLDMLPTIKILLVSLASYVAVQAIPKMASPILALLVNIIVFFGVYITLAPFVRAISRNDLKLFEIIFSEPALIGRIASPLIRYERFLVDLI